MAFIGKSKMMRTSVSQYEKTPRDLTYEDQFYSQITLVDLMHVVSETAGALSVLAIPDRRTLDGNARLCPCGFSTVAKRVLYGND